MAQKILASRPGEASHALWEEYCAHWQSYPDAYEVFRNISPPDLLQGAERYPRENDADEKQLGDDLLQASLLAPAAAARAVLALAARHASRRETLWPRMGWAPLAQATKHLADVARAFAEPLVVRQARWRKVTPTAAGASTQRRARRWPSRNRNNWKCRSTRCWRHSTGAGSKGPRKAFRRWFGATAIRIGNCPKYRLAWSCCSSMDCASIWRANSKCSSPPIRG